MAAGIVFLFPGQGSQRVGMGKAFFDAHVSVRRLFEEASDLSGIDLKRLCFEGPEDALAKTDVVQPAITLMNLACLEVVREAGVEPSATAGHSLGEYAALVAAGALTFADAIRLVRLRGAAMKEAADRQAGGMLAVFGIDLAAATAICDDVTAFGSVQVANQNSPSQIVLTGETAALAKAAEAAKARGAKLTVPLRVSGPWHSRFMATAQATLQEALSAVDIRPPAVPVIANFSADRYPADAGAMRSLLVDQVVNTVLWGDSMRTLIAGGATLFLELGPGKVLSGLMRDINRDVKCFNVEDPATFARFSEAWSGSRV